jgi:hypothetical protein
LKSPKSQLNLFFVRLFACAVPFIALVILYIFIDPFHVIGKLESPDDLHWNRDVISSRIFIRNNPTQHFKSFIFGNSRSLAFLTRDWAPYIHDRNAFHFDAFKESLFGIYTKIKYIDSNGNDLKNALIICDPTIFTATEDKTFAYIKDYKITGTSPLAFHFEFLKSFYTDFFFIRYIDYLLFKTYRPYMKDYIPGKREYFSYDETSNDPHYLNADMQEITADSLNYYKRSIFYKRKDESVISTQRLNTRDIYMLKEIKGIFNKHQTKYKIVIGPSYDMEYFNPVDLGLLHQIFGNNNVYDFSGKNSITNQIGNYYDYSHYKIYVGERILRAVYKGEKIL